MQIDKNIPMPKRGYELPFDQMEVGDSFALPEKVSVNYARQLIHQAQKGLSRQFRLRNTEEGYRIWRTA